jgi:hypothetical protein
MAKITSVTLHYAEKRTGNYQSVEHSMSVEITLEEGDTVKSVRDKYQTALRDSVTGFTKSEIDRLGGESRAGGGR